MATPASMHSRLQLLSSLVLTALIAIPAFATDARLREFHSAPLARPDQDSVRDIPRPVMANSATSLDDGEPPVFLVYPIAGTIGHDVAIPYYVDLDETTGKRDFNCGDLTFNGHSGHDPYIRSFAEQEIGVPVFAVRDGVVIDVRDGEPDENTTNDPSFKTNYVTLRHSPNQITQYVHLKRNSITVQKGNFVTAGTQIAQVGSSGASTAPHIHFEGRWNDVPYEPMAGPCRPGRDYFDEVPPVVASPSVLGAMFSRTSFEDVRPAPFADANPTGTFVKGNRTIYFRAELANVGASTTYKLSVSQPNGVASSISSGKLTAYDASLASAWWGIDVNLDRTGTWLLRLEVNHGERSFEMPFTVVGSSGAIVNRAPNAITAAVEPIGIRAGDVPVCRASDNGLADPDYDVVRYHYVWRANDEVVRDVTTAARSDALGRQYSLGGSRISCTVIASDGALSTQPSEATTVVNSNRRRAVAH